jgi:hypothetical protein
MRGLVASHGASAAARLWCGCGTAADAFPARIGQRFGAATEPFAAVRNRANPPEGMRAAGFEPATPAL